MQHGEARRVPTCLLAHPRSPHIPFLQGAAEIAATAVCSAGVSAELFPHDPIPGLGKHFVSGTPQ